jgi:purine-nucleoside phosphorylase
MSLVHVRAEPREFAENVLSPGDPRRAKYIAENSVDDA